MAPPTTSVPRAIASVTGFVTAAPRFAFSVRRVLCAALRFDALFAVPRLGEALARFEAVFVARDVMFAAVRPRALRPLALARDLDAVVFAGVLLRVEATVFFAAARPRALLPPALARDLDGMVLAGVLFLRVAAVLDPVFLEAAAFFFLGAAVFFVAGRPRALIPPLAFEVAVFDDLAIQDSFELGSTLPSVVTATAGKGARISSEQPRNAGDLRAEGAGLRSVSSESPRLRTPRQCGIAG
jgi:hypothetical protein